MKLLPIDTWSALKLVRGVIPIDLIHTDINEDLIHYSKVFKNNERKWEDAHTPFNDANNISINLDMFKERADNYKKIV